MRSHASTPFIALVAATLFSQHAARAADTYTFTITSASSSVGYTASASVPFAGNMTGDTTATPPTRTKRGTFSFPFFVTCGNFTPTTNEPIIISGAIAASGNGMNIRPTGAFTLSINPATSSSSVRGLSLNLLGTSSATITASLSNFRYETFCTVNPTCSQPFLTAISLPVGNVTVSQLTAIQPEGAALGTLTPAGANTFTFAIPMLVDVNATASLTGAPLPTAPQQVPIVFSGTIVLNGDAATVTNTLTVDLAPPATTTPVDLPPTPFSIPTGIPLVCGGPNLLLALTISSSTIAIGATANLTSSGTRILCPCDWNGVGGLTLQDLFDYLNSFFTNTGDFNTDGATSVQDIFDFFTCYFARPAGC